MYIFQYNSNKFISIIADVKYFLYINLYNLQKTPKKWDVDTYKITWYCFTIPFLEKWKEVFLMNCVAPFTTQYGIEVIISTILLVLVVIILDKAKYSAGCHVRNASKIWHKREAGS